MAIKPQTNLSWLEPGKSFPPKSQIPRIAKYESNRLLFENEYNIAFFSQIRRITVVKDNFKHIFATPIGLNYPQLMTLKTAQFVVGEPPDITAAVDTASTERTAEELQQKKQKIIDTVRERSAVDELVEMFAIDLDVFGDAPYRIYKPDALQPELRAAAVSPGNYYEIVREDDLKAVVHTVYCWVTNETDDIEDPAKCKYRLTAQIHSKGQYEKRVYDLKYKGTYAPYENRPTSSYEQAITGEYLGIAVPHYTIGKLRKQPEIIKTGVPDDFALKCIHNSRTSRDVYGIDNYERIADLCSEIMVILSRISIILDKHSAPTMTGPKTAVTEDADGESTLNGGMYIGYDMLDGQKIEYLTWDGQLLANFEQLKYCTEQLQILSEMGTALTVGAGSGQTASSGRALRLLLTNPLLKARAIANRIDKHLKFIISALSGGEIDFVPVDEITTYWYDGLPDDEMENTEMAAIQISSGIFSPKTVRSRLWNMKNSEDNEQEDELIRENRIMALAGGGSGGFTED